MLEVRGNIGVCKAPDFFWNEITILLFQNGHIFLQPLICEKPHAIGLCLVPGEMEQSGDDIIARVLDLARRPATDSH